MAKALPNILFTISRAKSFIVFCFLSTLFTSQLLAQNKVNDDLYRFGLGSYTFYFDSTQSQTVDEVAKLPLHKFNFDHSRFPLTGKQYLWLRLEFDFSSNTQKQWVYEIFNSKAAEFVVYSPNQKGAFHAIDTVGIDVPFYNRNVYSRVPVFMLDSLKKGRNVLMVKYKPFYIMEVNTEIKSIDSFVNYYNQHYFIVGGFYFVLLILMFYNFLFYVSTFDKVYLYYILFVALAALDCLMFDQLGFAILWPNLTFLNRIFTDMVRPLFVFGLVSYALYFLDAKRRFPKFHKFIWVVFVCYFFQQVSKFWTTNGFNQSLLVSELFIFSILLSIFYIAIARYRQGQKSVLTFLVGFTANFLGICTVYGFYHGFIKGSFFVYYVLFFSIFIDTIMFSFALSTRLRHERLEKEKAMLAESEARLKVIQQLQENETLLNKVNLELETKVQERTFEIEESKKKIAAQAEIIQQWNISLDKENWNLSKTVKDLNIRKAMPENLDYKQVQLLFPTETECYHLIANNKWKDGFRCKKCGNTKTSNTNDFYTRRCSKCSTIESITAHTIFHKIKFPLDKAFYIAYSVFTYKDSLNVSDLAKEIDLNYKTCLKFKMKIEDALEQKSKSGERVKSWEEVIVDI